MIKEKVIYEPPIEYPCYVVGCSENAAIYSDQQTGEIYYYPAENAKDFFDTGDIEDRNALKKLTSAPEALKDEIESRLKEIEELANREIDNLYDEMEEN